MSLLMAVVVAATTRGVLVAQNGTVTMFDRTSTKVIWSGEGLQTPTGITSSNDQAAIIDALNNEVRMIDLASGRGATYDTGETPIDVAFINRGLYILERDARALERIGADGTRASVPLAADPAFLRQANGKIYVYSRAAGVVQEITTSPFAMSRSLRVVPFASDFEILGSDGYLVQPRAAKIAMVSLQTMTPAGEVSAGAVPVDLAISSSMLAVADPSTKRIWMIEPRESFAQSFARGFLRGLIGLGIEGNRDFPTGIDRVIVQRSRLYAFDTSTGTLYHSSKAIAKGLAPQAFSIGPGGVYIWDDAVRRLQRIEPDE